MKTRKLNIRYLICFLLLAAVLALLGKVAFMLLTEQVSFGDEAADPTLSRLFGALLALPAFSYFYSFYIMLVQYIKHKGNAFALTENGIEDTVTFLMFLSLIFVLPVGRIPWEAVKSIDYSNGHYTAKIDATAVEAGKLAKLILRIRGYGFCYKFISPDITFEEIKQFCRCDFTKGAD